MKYPNVLVNVLSPAHLQAVINEGERAGYTPEQSYWSDFLRESRADKCVHFQEDGTYFIYEGFSAEYLRKHQHPRYRGSVIRQTRHLRKALSNTMASRDNLSTLCVRTRGLCSNYSAPYTVVPKPQEVIHVQPDAPIVWERPKAENTLVNKFLVLCAVACVKVKQAVNQIVKHLK